MIHVVRWWTEEIFEDYKDVWKNYETVKIDTIAMELDFEQLQTIEE